MKITFREIIPKELAVMLIALNWGIILGITNTEPVYVTMFLQSIIALLGYNLGLKIHEMCEANL